MNTCPDGNVGLFIGNESSAWQISDFQNAAQFALAHSIDTLFVKVFSGANGGVSGGPDEWYGAIGGASAVKAAIEAVGPKVIFYGYMYGNSHGSVLSMEIALVEKYMNLYGAFIADIETEWNGQVTWAQQMNAALASNTNLLYLSVLADPNEQNMVGVLQALAPSTNVIMPQVYDDHLAGIWQGEFTAAGLDGCLQPSFDLSGEFGANTPINDGLFSYGAVSFWEYSMAMANALLVDELIESKSTPPVVQISNTGEIADFCDADQFQPSKTQDACGFFAVWCCLAASQVGKACGLSAQQVINGALADYAAYDGDNSISNNYGMSLQQLYNLLTQHKLHWQGLNIGDPDILNIIRAWVRAGYPVIIAGAEAGMYDIGLGDRVPYYWNYQSFNHIITITGVKSDGTFLVRDSANVTDLYNPNSLRPGPRNYDPSKLQLISATAVVLPWMPRPPAGFDPRKDSLSMVPTGWKDNGTILTAPNGVEVQHGFRQTVLNSTWDSANWPLGNEYAILQVEDNDPSTKLPKGGTAQDFMYGGLYYDANSGHIGNRKIGQDYEYQKSQANAALAAVTSLQAQIASLQQQISSQIPSAVQQAINDADKAVTALKAELDPFVK